MKVPFVSLIFCVTALCGTGCTSLALSQEPRRPAAEKQVYFYSDLQSDRDIQGHTLVLSPRADGTVLLKWNRGHENPTIGFDDPVGCLATPTVEAPEKGVEDGTTVLILTRNMQVAFGGMPEPGAPSGFRLYARDQMGNMTFAAYLVPVKSGDPDPGTVTPDSSIDPGFAMKIPVPVCQ